MGSIRGISEIKRLRPFELHGPRGTKQNATEGGLLCVPLIGREGGNLGLIQITAKDNGELDAEDEAILVQLAQLAAEAVENTRLLNEVSAAREHLQTLSGRLVHLQEDERGSIAQGRRRSWPGVRRRRRRLRRTQSTLARAILT